MPKPKETPIPPDFQVNVDHRLYATKLGSPFLADVFLTDFKELFEDNGRKHKNWDMTFKRYIRGNSPTGRFYKPDYWERKLQQAKSMQYGVRKRQEPDYHPQELTKPREMKSVPAMFTELRNKLKQA